MGNPPSVEILIPTYNRRELLERSLASALSQDYPNISILVSDNGSSDNTKMFLASKGVRHVSHSINYGGLANLNFLWNSAKADIRMFLADDDWIDSSYVSCCVKYMLKTGCKQVSGKSLHYANNKQVGADSVYSLLDEIPLARLHRFCSTINTSNDIFYGLRKRANYYFSYDWGSDFTDTYHSILKGKIGVTSETSIHRDFSQWHGEQLAETEERIFRSIKVGDGTISLHSLFSYFTICSAIRVSLACSWDCACMFALVVTPERTCLDVAKILVYLSDGGTAIGLCSEENFPRTKKHDDFVSKVAMYSCILESLLPSHPSAYLARIKHISHFSGLCKSDLHTLGSLWNDFILRPGYVTLKIAKEFWTAKIIK